MLEGQRRFRERERRRAQTGNPVQPSILLDRSKTDIAEISSVVREKASTFAMTKYVIHIHLFIY